MENDPNDAETRAPVRSRYRVRLPGMLIEKEIGLGDLIKKSTYAIGINPCSGCEERSSALNRWMSFYK